MISLANRSASFTSILLFALSKTQLMAVLLLNLIAIGIGIGSDLPPPARPLSCRILISGARESKTAVKYFIGESGSRLIGPALGSNACPGLVDLFWGGGAVRSVSRTSETTWNSN
jgi:hypothetical protein